MKTRHATTNYKMIVNFVKSADKNDGHIRIINGSYMPLVIENLGYCDHDGHPVYSITHYGEQNGDAMRDPDVTFSVDAEKGTILPLTYQNDYMGRYDEIFIMRNGKLCYSPRLLHSIDDFLWQWLKNLKAQGFAELVA